MDGGRIDPCVLDCFPPSPSRIAKGRGRAVPPSVSAKLKRLGVVEYHRKEGDQATYYYVSQRTNNVVDTPELNKVPEVHRKAGVDVVVGKEVEQTSPTHQGTTGYGSTQSTETGGAPEAAVPEQWKTSVSDYDTDVGDKWTRDASDAVSENDLRGLENTANTRVAMSHLAVKAARRAAGAIALFSDIVSTMGDTFLPAGDLQKFLKEVSDTVASTPSSIEKKLGEMGVDDIDAWLDERKGTAVEKKVRSLYESHYRGQEAATAEQTELLKAVVARTQANHLGLTEDQVMEELKDKGPKEVKEWMHVKGVQPDVDMLVIYAKNLKARADAQRAALEKTEPFDKQLAAQCRSNYEALAVICKGLQSSPFYGVDAKDADFDVDVSGKVADVKTANESVKDTREKSDKKTKHNANGKTKNNGKSRRNKHW